METGAGGALLLLCLDRPPGKVPLSDPESAPEPASRVDHPCCLVGGQTPDEWAEAFFRKLANRGTLYRKESEGALYLVLGARRPRLISDFNTFAGILPSLCTFLRVGQQGIALPELLRTDFATILYHSPHRSLLPNLRTVIQEPAIVFGSSNSPRITPSGYDPLTNILLWEPSTTSYIPRSTTTHLEKCFSGVPFQRPTHRANVIASLLGALVIDHHCESPLLTISGNQPGIGKTKLCTAMGYILLGNEPAPVSWGQKEMPKELGARFRENQRFILLDNVVSSEGKAYSNNTLATLLTQGHSKRVRELGFSRSVSQEGVLFVLTANHCVLHEDLAVRALMVKLYREKLGAMVPYVLDYAKEFRKELFEELLGLALYQIDSAITNSFAASFRFRNWLTFVAPRVIPHFGPLALEEASDTEAAAQDLFSWGYEKLKDDPAFEFDGASLLRYIECASEETVYGLRDRLANCRNRRAREQVISQLLTNMLGRPSELSQGVNMSIEQLTSSRPRRYRFTLSEDRTSTEGSDDFI